MVRKIIHVDMDAFYASVEQRDRPEYRGKPVIVGGSPEKRGVVASASYEARKFGIRSAMSSRKAHQLCPQAIFVRPDFQKYKEASVGIRKIFFEVTDLVEPLSLDEAYLDVTQNHLNEPSATRIAEYIRRRIFEELKLTASAGVAPNKFLAKLASDLRKPNGLYVISPQNLESFIAFLPVEKLWGVGPATTKKLHALGIKTTADVRAQSKLFLEQKLGSFGPFIFNLAHGKDDREVSSNREAKSRGAETTFEKDILDMNFLKTTLKELSEEVALSLQKLNCKAKTVTLKIRYADFTTITRSQSVSTGLNTIEFVKSQAIQLLSRTEAGKKSVRLVGVSASNFKEEGISSQLVLDL